MRRRVLTGGAALAFLVLAAASSKISAFGAPGFSYAGYTPQSAAAEHDWEARYRKLPDPEKAREYMQYLTAHPHWVGSPYGKTYPEWIQSHLIAWGLAAKIETFSVLFPSPKERVLELLGPEPFRAKLAEPPVKGDPTSFQSTEQLPTYNAYGADGDVTAPAVYVNYGLPSDYETLARMGISVKGAIAIARYGKCWRGVKVTVAREHGALGCLLYSDPADDGYATNAGFPRGPARSPDSVQRGGVTENHYQGDPLTPGGPSIPGAPRIKREAADTIQKIPVLPISYADAKPFLEHLDGPIAPPAWRGALPITYRLGPGTTKVHLKVTSDWEQKNVYDVIASIPGSVHPNEWILRGNHHDAWTYGAFDPISGVASLMEEARSLATLMKQGWRPKRTVVLCFWDGEEPANLGSTEWVEAHAEELKQHGAAYINTDASLRGVLGIEGIRRAGAIYRGGGGRRSGPRDARIGRAAANTFPTSRKPSRRSCGRGFGQRNDCTSILRATVQTTPRLSICWVFPHSTSASVIASAAACITPSTMTSHGIRVLEIRILSIIRRLRN